jgi:hypothetical protein
MGMRETTRSIRAYFIVAGSIALLLGLRDLSTVGQLGSMLGSLPMSWQLALWFPLLSQIALAACFIWAGVSLPTALPRGAGWIKTLMLVTIIVQVVDMALVGAVLGTELGTTALVRSFIALLIAAYLLANIRRMADEEMAKNATAQVVQR